jgi:curved DNA-binding protein CbpA
VPARRDAKRPRRDHYTVLGVQPSASAREITSAYRRLVRTLHPDANPARPAARERLAEVVDAYATLHDPARRAAYDAEREHRTSGTLKGRPIKVRVTHTPGAADRGADLANAAVDLSRPAAPLCGVLLWAGPARLYPPLRGAGDDPPRRLGRPWFAWGDWWL